MTTDGRLKTDPVFVEGGAAVVYTMQELPTQTVLMQLDMASGRSERLRPEAKTSEFEPAFSADGRYLAYVQSRGNLNLKLVIHDSLENKDNVFDPGGGFSGMREPAFSPSGDRLAFSIPAAGGQQIETINTQAGDRRPLTQSPGINNWPCYSPDGSRIAFGSSRDGDFEIYSMRADGGDVRRLTASPGRDVRPCWSPDGRRIAFATARDGNMEIYVMDADGGPPRNITAHADSDDFPAWHPDGQRIVTVSQRDGQSDLYLWKLHE